MPGLNSNMKLLETMALGPSSSAQKSDIERDVITTGLELRISGDVTISGGSASGTLLAETPHNLIDYVMMEKDGDEYVGRIPGKMLAAFQRFIHPRPPRFITLENGDAGVNLPFFATYFIPFALPWLANPFETAQYFPSVARSHTVQIKRIATVNAASFLTGSDRTLVLNSLNVQPIQHFATSPVTFRPKLQVRYVYDDSRVIDGTVPNFRNDLTCQDNERIAFALLAFKRDGLGVGDILNSLTFGTPRNEAFQDIPQAVLLETQQRFYGGIDAASGSTQTGAYQGMPNGYYAANYVQDIPGSRPGTGKIMQAVRAIPTNNYRYLANVTDGGGTQLIRTMKTVLRSVPGWTLM